MSRCFPFPPPGYEAKASLYDRNLLDKEKQEKKHKKEKKDKEKKGKKEKKDKKEKKEKDKKGEKRKHKKEERSEDEHRENKVPTEEHKDDSKTRQIERIRTSAENSTRGPVNCSNGKSHGSNCTQRDETIKFKFSVELEKRFRDDDRAKENPSIQKSNLTCKRNTEISGIVVKDKRDHDREVFGQSNEVVARADKNCSRPNFVGGDKRKDERVSDVVDKYVDNRTEHKENGVHKNADSKSDRHKDTKRDKKRKSKDKKREDKEAKVKEPYEERLIASETNMNAVCFNIDKSSSLWKEGSNTSNLGKRKELERNGFLLHEQESRPNKLWRTLLPLNVVENAKSSLTLATSTQPMSKLVDKEKDDIVNSKFSSCDPDMENGFKLEAARDNNKYVPQRQETNNNYKVSTIQSSHSVLQSDWKSLYMSSAAEEFASKRQVTSNGHNMDCKVSLCGPLVGNGKSDYQATTHLASGGDGTINNQKVDHNALKINGLIEDKKQNVGSTRPSSKSKYVKKNGGISTKPPHPDSKYLSQILNIPTPELSDVDNQDWLFGSYDRQLTKSASGSSQVEETKQVWAEALRIESADVIALPYVIRY